MPFSVTLKEVMTPSPIKRSSRARTRSIASPPCQENTHRIFPQEANRRKGLSLLLTFIIQNTAKFVKYILGEPPPAPRRIRGGAQGRFPLFFPKKFFKRNVHFFKCILTALSICFIILLTTFMLGRFAVLRAAASARVPAPRRTNAPRKAGTKPRNVKAVFL